MEEPKDLGVKIVDKEKKYWLEMKERLEKDNELMQKQIEINNVVLIFLCNKLSDEKEKI